MRRILILLLLLAPLGCSILQGPDPAATVFRAPRSEAEAGERLAFLEARLDEGKLHAQAWQWGWTAIDAGGLGLSVWDAASADDAGDRAFGIVQATLSGIGLVDLWLLRPMPGRHGADRIRTGDPATRLERAEVLLVERAARTESRWDWKLHLANVGLQVAGAGVLLAVDEPGLAALSFGLGIAGGELFIWSEPWNGNRDLADYRRLVETGLPAEPPTTLRLVPWHGGLALRLEY